MTAHRARSEPQRGEVPGSNAPLRRLAGAFAQPARFVIVGLTATLVYTGVTALLIDGLRVESATLAACIGTLFGLLVSYFGNLWWTFRAQGRHQDFLPRFALVYGAVFLFNGATMWLLEERLGLHYAVPLAITVVVSPVITYLCNRHFVFRRARG